MTEFKFPKRMRLLTPRDFERVMAMRSSVADGKQRVYGAPNTLGHPRLGLVVSRKVGGAVERNRWKRAIRDAFRLAQHDLPSYDLVCIPHRDSEPDPAELGESLRQLAVRIAARPRREGGG